MCGGLGMLVGGLGIFFIAMQIAKGLPTSLNKLILMLPIEPIMKVKQI